MEKQDSGLPQDALRIQAAAVAAQQAALGEEETRLRQRVQALEQQEIQLSAHLEEKRRRLVQLHEKTLAERAALKKERTTYEQYVERVTGDLSQGQRELVESQQQVQAERRRLGELHRRLRQRWQKHWNAEKQKMLLREEELANEECNLAREREILCQQEETLHQDRLRFNGQYEIGRRQIFGAWSKLRQAQHKWHQRRHQERAALCVRGRDLEEAEVALARARRGLQQDIDRWQLQRQAMEKELEGLNNRIAHQRDKVGEQHQEIQKLAGLILERRKELNPPTTDAKAMEGGNKPQQSEDSPLQSPLREVASPAPAPLPLSEEGRRRLTGLDRLAGELADQRLQLAEQWEWLIRTEQAWRQERDQTAADLHRVGQRLHEQEQGLVARGKACAEEEETLRQKYRELAHRRQQIVGWRARLRTRESAWEGERNHLLAEVRQREKLVEHHLNNLVEIRRRWAQNRRQEIERLRTENSRCETLRKEYAALRREWHRRCASLNEEKRILTEKSLALEQYRQETYGGEGPEGERRLERLRRSWLAQNTAVLRELAQTRQTLAQEFTNLENRFADLNKRGDELTAAETSLAEKHAAWEHKKALLAARQAQIEQELKIAQTQRGCTETQLLRMKEELERLARELIEDPSSAPLGKAA